MLNSLNKKIPLFSAVIVIATASIFLIAISAYYYQQQALEPRIPEFKIAVPRSEKITPTSQNNNGLPAATSVKLEKGEISMFLVTGIVPPDKSTVEYFEVFGMTQAEKELTPSNKEGEFALRAYNLEQDSFILVHEVLFDLSYSVTRFPVVLASKHSDSEISGFPDIGSFLIIIPEFVKGKRVDKIDIVLIENSKVLISRQRSPNPPVIAFVNPKQGQELTHGMEISWTGSDADGDELVYFLSYSWDRGKRSFPLVFPMPGDPKTTSYILNTNYESVYEKGIPGSDPGAAILILKASDGMNTVSVKVDNLTQPDKKRPMISIESPREGRTYRRGSGDFSLKVNVQDAEDVFDIPDESIEWYSDIGGFLTKGIRIYYSSRNLSLGKHKISVTVTDSDGMSSTDSVNIEIVE